MVPESAIERMQWRRSAKSISASNAALRRNTDPSAARADAALTEDTHTTVGKRLVMPACQQRNILSYPNRPQHGFDLIQHAMLIAAKTSLELAQLRIVHVRQIKLPHNEPNVCVQVMSASVLDIAPLRERPPPRSVIDSSRDIRASTNMRPSGFHPMLANARQNAFTHCGTHIDPGRQILRTSERQHVQPIGLRQVLSIRRHRDHGM
ncbi:hypothetical protein G6F24_011375 [Rhizopus arrhizus]|nr:hypothetical protein G6F24_011375 [Rhizopus arrhizus]